MAKSNKRDHMAEKRKLAERADTRVIIVREAETNDDLSMMSIKDRIRHRLKREAGYTISMAAANEYTQKLRKHEAEQEALLIEGCQLVGIPYDYVRRSI